MSEGQVWLRRCFIKSIVYARSWVLWVPLWLSPFQMIERTGEGVQRVLQWGAEGAHSSCKWGQRGQEAEGLGWWHSVPFLSTVAFPRRSKAPWSPQFPIWIIAFGPANTGILRSHTINSNHVCGPQNQIRETIWHEGEDRVLPFGFETGLHILVLWPWASHCSSLSLGFLICKMGS